LTPGTPLEGTLVGWRVVVRVSSSRSRWSIIRRVVKQNFDSGQGHREPDERQYQQHAASAPASFDDRPWHLHDIDPAQGWLDFCPVIYGDIAGIALRH
jgi:hypothetical protein